MKISGLPFAHFPYCNIVIVDVDCTAHNHGIGDAAIRNTVDHALARHLPRPASNETPGGHAMTDPGTDSGRALTDEELEALAAEVAERDYEVDVLKKRRCGRPPMGSGPAKVVPVRIDPELLAALKAREETEHATMSEINRDAIRRFLDVA
jgi:uncharacterized protein (DUF4415 family)